MDGSRRARRPARKRVYAGSGGGAVVVDFHARQRDAGPLPRIAQGRDARMDLGVAQTVHAAVEAQHHDGGPAGGGQGRQGGRRVGPLAVRGHVGGQHAPGPHQIGAVSHRGSHGRRPAALPDIGIVVQGRIGLAASRHEDAAQDDGNAAMRRVGGRQVPANHVSQAGWHGRLMRLRRWARLRKAVILAPQAILRAAWVLALRRAGCQMSANHSASPRLAFLTRS